MTIESFHDNALHHYETTAEHIGEQNQPFKVKIKGPWNLDPIETLRVDDDNEARLRAAYAPKVSSPIMTLVHGQLPKCVEVDDCTWMACAPLNMNNTAVQGQTAEDSKVVLHLKVVSAYL